jgi:hydrogenase maturation protease
LKCLVLGLGNLLLGDEGVGVHAVQALEAQVRHDDVEVLSPGTAVLEVLPSLEKAEHVIIVDAMKGGQIPGTIYRVLMEECDFEHPIASLHGFDIGRVLALSGAKTLPEVVVIGIEPAVIGWSLELSPHVERALPDLLKAIKREIEQSITSTRNPASSSSAGTGGLLH